MRGAQQRLASPHAPWIGTSPDRSPLHRRPLRWARGQGEQSSAERLLVDDKSAAATTGAISEQEVVEAISRPPRREFDKAIRRQGDARRPGW